MQCVKFSVNEFSIHSSITHFFLLSSSLIQEIQFFLIFFYPKKEIWAEQGNITTTQSPVLGRHCKSDNCTDSLVKEKATEESGDKSEMMNHIEVGYVYEIDHIYLPPRTPAQLRSIRVAMVCEKTEMNVVVRYPSMDSLKALFSYRTEYPDLDEKFVMGKALASKLLFRLVPPEILSEQKSLQGFWLISDSLKYCGDLISEKHDLGSCFSELKCNGMVRWGIRRQVRYLGRHRETDDIGTKNIYVQNSSSNLVNGVENGVEKGYMNLLGDDCDVKESESEEEEEEVGDDDDDGDGINGEKKVKEEDEDEEEEEEEEEDEYEEKKILKSNKNLKRKRYFFRNSANRKKPKKENQNKKRNKNKNRTRFNEALVVLKNPEHRWSSGRYNLAEQNLFEVMKAKGATAEKPILRPKLRAEARKRIGDTGLLDHLLKHIAGKIAPGGEQRFRRRHNADGAMEYWLESAELVNIRNDVGITDPYWVPPPGWTPGDSPTQDPLCAKELKLLKDDILVIKRELELGVKRKQLEEEIGKLRREVDELSSELSLKKRQQEENQLIAVISSPCKITQKFNHFAHSLTASKIDPPVPLEKYKEQLLVISDFVKEMKEKIEKLTSDVGERARSDNSTLMVPEKKQVYKQQQEVQAFIAAGNERTEFQNKSLENAASIEQKSANIQRLKSGFRICKPQGTFLWPNMVKNNNNNNNVVINLNGAPNSSFSTDVGNWLALSNSKSAFNIL